MLLSREELDETAQMHPEVAEYLKKNPPVDLDNSTHVALRNAMAEGSRLMKAQLGPAPPGLSDVDHDITLRDGSKSTIRIQRPAAGPAGPLIVLYFGGGFVAGDKDQLAPIGRTLVALFGATVVLVGYRLAPEHPYPAAQYDSWDTTKWAAENASDPLLNADPSKGFIIGGVSAGAAITASLSRAFQEDKLAHPVTGQWLCVPSLMDKASCPEKYRSLYIAVEQNSEGPSLNRASRDMMTKATKWDTTSGLRYAAAATTQIADQPRTYTQVDGMDPLRDDGLIYDEMLKEAGVPTKIDLYPGCPHAHFFGMRGLEISNRATIDMFVGFGWLLEKEVARADVAKMLRMEVA